MGVGGVGEDGLWNVWGGVLNVVEYKNEEMVGEVDMSRRQNASSPMGSVPMEGPKMV